MSAGGVSTNSTDIKKAAFLEAFQNKSANITEACRGARIDRTTYYYWCKSDESFKQRVEDIQEGLLDLAENKLQDAINKNNLTAIIFFLKTKGRSRGYIERQEINQSGHMEISGQLDLGQIIGAVKDRSADASGDE